MRFVSSLLKRAVYPPLAKAGVFRHKAMDGLSIVTYHGVLPEGYRVLDPALDGSLVDAPMFRRQLRLLRENYNVISPEQLLQWCKGQAELPQRALLVTCDDGLVNVVSDMLPILQSENVPCLFFVIGLSSEDIPRMLWYEELYLMLAAARGKVFSMRLGGAEIVGSLESPDPRRALWRYLTQRLEQCDYQRCSDLLEAIRGRLGLKDQFAREYLSDECAQRRFRLLGPAELLILLDAGMSIGAHTLSHPMLSQLPEDRAWFEISEGRRRLEKVLKREVWAFAYPFGGPVSVSSREFAMAGKAGYKAAFLSFGGGFGADLPRHALPRIHVTGDMTLAELEAHVSGFYRGLRQRFGRDESIVTAPAA